MTPIEKHVEALKDLVEYARPANAEEACSYFIDHVPPVLEELKRLQDYVNECAKDAEKHLRDAALDIVNERDALRAALRSLKGRTETYRNKSLLAHPENVVFFKAELLRLRDSLRAAAKALGEDHGVTD